MQITEQNKQEAEKVLDKHKFVNGLYHNYLGLHNAIQDRQSVLEDNQSVLEMLFIHGHGRQRLPIHERITNLTEQIEFLKSKL